MSIWFYTAAWTECFHKNVRSIPWHLWVIHMIVVFCRCQHKPSVWLQETASSLQLLFLLANQLKVKTCIALSGILSLYNKRKKYRKTKRQTKTCMLLFSSSQVRQWRSEWTYTWLGHKGEKPILALDHYFLNNQSLAISPCCSHCQAWLQCKVSELSIYRISMSGSSWSQHVHV